jgi:uncharacterized membrane protein
MRFSQLVGDLRFIIGSFLSVIGLIVLIEAARHSDTLTQGIHVNLLGGGMLLGTGILLIASTYFESESP